MNLPADIGNLLGLAQTALIGGNNEEALSYFNRVLEIDPKLSEAWIGKGKSSVWQSNLVNIRIPEAVIAFNHAIATADEAEKNSTLEMVVQELNGVVVALYGVARDHMIKFVSLDSSWPDYLIQVSQLIDGLETARGWLPNDRTTLENIVHLCKDNIEGFSFRDEYNQNMPGAHSITPEYEQFLKTRMNDAINGLKAIDSTYEPPAIEKKQADSCFVVTATMGDFNHPNVTVLRAFRDQWILKQTWGVSFVDHYYRYGPIAADVIKKSRVLRALSYIFIVFPASRLAKSKVH